VSLREDLNLWTPRLRRYARALCSGTPGRAELADDLVHTALLRILKDETGSLAGDLGIRLYGSVTELHRDHIRRLDLEDGRQSANGDYEPSRHRPVPESWHRAVHPPEGIVAGLASMKLGDREALLLVVLEQCGYGRTTRILKISRVELILRLSRARLVLGKTLGPTGDTRVATRGHLRIVK
jgi:DNA-directed RNA polymerase specialized sigma24 family protein